MKLRRAGPRVPSETIVALIDVVFFLLVFFMLVGRMDATAQFDVEPPVSNAGTDMPAGGTTLTIAADGRTALDGREVEAGAVRAGIADQLRTQPDLFVRIYAHRTARLGDVLPLVAAIEELGVNNLVFVVTPEAP